MQFSLFSGIMLSLGANYLASESSGIFIVLKGLAWILSGFGMMFLGEMLNESRQNDLRAQRAKLFVDSERGDAASVAIGHLAVIQPRQGEMIGRIKSLCQSNKAYQIKMVCSILFALVLPAFLMAFLVEQKLFPTKIAALVEPRKSGSDPVKSREEGQNREDKSDQTAQ